jgi:transcriptional regulator with XRE-family HTH domain
MASRGGRLAAMSKPRAFNIAGPSIKTVNAMEMKVDSERVRAERRKRAWSQEHLAGTTGLGLRTIQRIESTGTASNESISALASVFSIPLSDIGVPAPAAPSMSRLSGPRRKLIGFGAASVAGVCSILAFSLAFADDVSLDVGISRFESGQEAASQVAMTKLLVEDGDDADLALDGVARFVITPTVRADGLILIAVGVFEFDGSEYVKTREPRVLTENGRAAKIEFGSRAGDVLSVSITPREPE